MSLDYVYILDEKQPLEVIKTVEYKFEFNISKNLKAFNDAH